MRYGIPAYRLPRDRVAKEIARIEAMGVKITLNHRVEDVLAEKEQGGFDAVFVAIGAQVANHLGVPVMDGAKMIDAVSMLEQLEKGKAPTLGRVVGVVGGGNVAMDAARVAKRLGAEEAVLIFRFDQPHMEAYPSEAKEAFAEGVKIKWLSTVKQFDRDDVLVEQMAMTPDGKGCIGTGKFERLKANSLVLAVGQHADLGFLHDVARRRHRPRRHGRGRRVDEHRPPRRLRGRRRDRRAANNDGSRGTRKEGGAQHRDVGANAGCVSVGIDHDTAQFAVNAIRRWREIMGRERYPESGRLMIAADGGGSNGSRVRLWKVELQKFADETGLTIVVCHYPPGTSKWNKIEHRLFCHITQNWRGQPLTSRSAVVELIAATTTKTGLTVRCELDASTYEKGIKVSDAEMAALNIEGDAFHPEWNCTVKPRPSRGSKL